MSLRKEDELEVAESLPEEVAIAGSVIPYRRSDNKAKYLGYMACGFSIREACKILNITKAAVSIWRQDPQFVEYEKRIPEYKVALAKEYISMEFFRNYRLVLEQDYRVLWKVLNPNKVTVQNATGEKELDEPLSKQDADYLLKIRSQYSGEQLHMLEAIVSSSGENFNFAMWVQKNADVIKVSRTQTQTLELSHSTDILMEQRKAVEAADGQENNNS